MTQPKIGQVQVYTGDGKGKTTAALGLALRAYGAGRRVFVGQFCKGREVAEHAGLALLDGREHAAAAAAPGGGRRGAHRPAVARLVRGRADPRAAAGGAGRPPLLRSPSP